MPTANNLPGQNSFLGGLSAGIGNFLLAERMKQESQTHENRQYIVNTMAKMMDHVRPEDLSSALTLFDKAINSKNEKELHEAYGSFSSRLVPEDWNAEQAAKAQNANADQVNNANDQTALAQAQAYQQALANGGLTIGTPTGTPLAGPATIGESLPTAKVQPEDNSQSSYIAQQEADAVRKAAIAQLPEGVTAKIFAKPTDPGYAPDKVLLPTSQAEPDAKPIPLAKVDPAAYAKGKIRMQTEEGKQSRQLAIFSKQQEIRQQNDLAKIQARADARMSQIQEQMKKGAYSYVPDSYSYDPESDQSSFKILDKNTGQVSVESSPGKALKIQEYDLKVKAEAFKEEKAKAELALKESTEKFKEDIATKRLDKWIDYTKARIKKFATDAMARQNRDKLLELKMQADRLKTEVTTAASTLKSAMGSLSGTTQAQVKSMREELKAKMDAYKQFTDAITTKLGEDPEAQDAAGQPTAVPATPKAKVQGRTRAQMLEELKKK